MAKEDQFFKTIAGAGFEWVHLARADEATTAELGRRYGFHELDLKDALPPLQRPKVVDRGEYLFVILLFPVFDRTAREIKISEVDFFVSRERLVTVNHDTAALPTLSALVEKVMNDPTTRRELFADGLPMFFYRLLERLLDESFPMLVHVSQDIDAMERKLWDVKNKKMVFDILRIRTNIVEFRRAIQWHKVVIEDLIAEGERILETKQRADYWSDLVVMTKEAWSFLESQRETVNALHETHSSLLSFHTNEVMKTLTVFSATLLPLTLLVSLFGMNVSVPFGHLESGFWIIVALCGAVLIGLLVFLKKKQWI